MVAGQAGALPKGLLASRQAGAFLGVLGVLFVLAKALATQSGKVPIKPLARRQYAARGAPQTFPPRLAAEDAPPRWRRSQSAAALPCLRPGGRRLGS